MGKMKKSLLYAVVLSMVLLLQLASLGAAFDVTQVWINDSDMFYSNYPGNDIVHIWVNVSFAGTDEGTGSVSADFNTLASWGTTIDCGSGSGTILLSNASTGDPELFTGSCDVGAESLTPGNGAPFNGGSVLIAASALIASAPQVINGNAMIILYNMTTPPSQPGETCERFGSDTTNFSQELDFNHINFVMSIEKNGSYGCNGETMNGLPWGDSFAKVFKMNFTDLNFSDQSIGTKLAGLGSAVIPYIVPPGLPGDSYIYVNASAFEELNTSASITFYGLPFSYVPEVIGEEGSVSVSDYIIGSPFSIYVDENLTMHVPNMTLSFTVGHFSQYNMTDNSTPTIIISAPTTGYNSSAQVIINVTVNGTGTQLGAINLTINGASIYDYDNSDIFDECENLTADWDVVVCVYNATGLSTGEQNLTVVATDLGGSAGNTNFESVIFFADGNAPITNVSTSRPGGDYGGYYKSPVNITFNATDDYSGINYTSYYFNSAWYNGTNFTLETDGDWIITYYSVDNSGNREENRTVQYSYDTTAPDTTTDYISSWNSIPFNVSFTVAAGDVSGPGLFFYKIDDGDWNFVAWNGSGPGYPSNVLISTEGNYTIYYYSVDNANNSETTKNISGILLDLNAPNITGFSPEDDYLSGAASVDFTVNATDSMDFNLSCGLYMDDSLQGTFPVINSSPAYSFSLDDGIRAYYWNCTDNANHSTVTETRNFVVDTSAPNITMTSPNASTYPGSSIPLTYTVSDYSNVSCQYSLDGAANVSLPGCANTTLYIANGTHNLILYAIDSLDHLSSASVGFNISDETAPVISGASPSGSQISSTTEVTLSVTTDENASCRYSTDPNMNYTNMTNNFTGTGLVHTATYGGLTAGSSYTLYARCQDMSNNTNNASATVSFSVASASSSSGGGGGGGGSASVRANPSSTRLWMTVPSGVPQLMIISGSTDFGITGFDFTLGKAAGSSQIILELLPSRPSNTTVPEGKVYKYQKVTRTGFDDQSLSGYLLIKFKVAKSWLVSEGLEPKDVVMKRFSDGKWVDLSSLQLSEDANFHYYEASSPGFSYFVIGEKNVVDLSAKPVVQEEKKVPDVTAKVTIPEPVAAPEAKPETVKEPLKFDMPKGSTAWLVVLGVMMVMIVILLIVHFKHKAKWETHNEYSQEPSQEQSSGNIGSSRKK